MLYARSIVCLKKVIDDAGSIRLSIVIQENGDSVGHLAQNGSTCSNTKDCVRSSCLHWRPGLSWQQMKSRPKQGPPPWNATGDHCARNMSLSASSPDSFSPSTCIRKNFDSSGNNTILHWGLFHLAWVRLKFRRASLWRWVSYGFFAGTLDLKLSAWMRFRTVWVDTSLLAYLSDL